LFSVAQDFEVGKQIHVASLEILVKISQNVDLVFREFSFSRVLAKVIPFRAMPEASCWKIEFAYRYAAAIKLLFVPSA
jgi:hypothetical protein